MSDRYNAVRKYEHSTLGDSVERFDRDADAFTAGAQYALDNMLARLDGLPENVWGDYITGSAADILANVHDGIL